MREILFRGKRVDTGEWVYGWLCDCFDFKGVFHPAIQEFECAPKYEVNPETVGQFTGLAADSKKIFEGDIIKSEQDGMIGVIRFGEYQTTNSGNGECHLGFSIEWYGKYSDIIRRDLGWWVKTANKDINIVGSVHDNPELLEVK